MSEAAKQFRNELSKLIHRYSHEADIVVGEIVMVLEVEKFNVLMSEQRYLDKKEKEENGE